MKTIIAWLFGAKDGDLTGGTDWRLGFIADYHNYITLGILLAALFMVYLTIRSYRREGQNSPKVKYTLAVIRIVAIVLAMMVIFRPAIVLRYTRTLRSTVVVLMDDSMSMSFKDRYTEGDEGKKLAAAMDIQPAELYTKSRTDVVRHFLGKGVLEKLAKDHPVEIVRFACGPQQSYTQRLALIEDMIVDDKKPKPTATSGPANIAKALGSLNDEGFETNLPAALRDSIDGLQGRKGYIVLISDGRMTAEGAANRVAGVREFASQRGCPLYVVNVGNPVPPKNLAVLGIQVPREVRIKSTVVFGSKIAHRGLVGQTATVRLQRRYVGPLQNATPTSGPTSGPSSAPAATMPAPVASTGPVDPTDWQDVKVEQVKLEAGTAGTECEDAKNRGEQTVEMSIEQDERTGEFVYRVYVDPREDEQATEDNYAEIPVRVNDKSVRVLLICGTAGWEGQVLRNYLLAQNELYRLSVWQESADPDVNQSASTGMKLTEFPNSIEYIMGSEKDPAKYPGYDAVILYDPQPTKNGFDQAFVDNLKKAVATHGVGFCYIVGNKYSHANLGTKDEQWKSLRDLMPVRVSNREIPDAFSDKRPEPWPMLITAYGAEHPVLRIAATNEDSALKWESLPGIYWAHEVEGLKPLARVLMENGNTTRKMGKQPEPLMVVQPFGSGRVVYMNTDETWRWRSIEDGKYYKAFWTNMIKYLAPTSPRRVIITTGGDRFNAGKPIDIDVQAYDETFQPLKLSKEKGEKEYIIRMRNKATGETFDIGCRPLTTEDKPGATADKLEGHFKGTISEKLTVQQGVYELLAPKAIDSNLYDPKQIKIELPQAEMTRPEADPVTMESIASKPENVMKIQDVDKLTDLIPPGKLPLVSDKPRELWDSRLTLIILVTLLTIEWILRKKYNMA